MRDPHARLKDGLDGLHGEPGEREQTVLTPSKILQPLRNVWGGPINLDPCAAPEGPVWVACDGCKGTGKRKDGKPCKCKPPHGAWWQHTVNALVEVRLPDDGLAFPWIDCTFCNPQYDTLEPWLAPQIEEGARVAWLVPVRPHRRWWRRWARDCDAVIYLDPFAFVGHVQTIPIPICLGYVGHDVAAIVGAFADLGEPL